MTDVLLIVLIASVWVNIWVSLRIAKAIDKPDLSKEDATVKHATDNIEDAQRHLPPQN